MAKTKIHSHYVCQQCGRISAGFMGKCPQCGSFNSMIEEIIAEETGGAKTASRGLSGRSTPRSLSEIGSQVEERIAVPIEEFSRVLGGGLVSGSIVLVGGDPGREHRDPHGRSAGRPPNSQNGRWMSALSAARRVPCGGRAGRRGSRALPQTCCADPRACRLIAYSSVSSLCCGNAGSTMMTSSRCSTTLPGFAPFGLCTYLRRVTVTGTMVAVRILL